MSEEIEEIPNVIISKIYLENIIYIYTIQEAYQLKDFLITTANINKYDYDTMIKDLEATTRHEDHLKKIRRKWLEESKKYKEAVEHMKEYQEETYKKKNSELVNKLKKKDQVLLTVLKKNQQSKMKERQKAIESMMEKESKKQVEGQFDLFNMKLADISRELDKINVNELTPIEALNTLSKLKDMIK